MFAHVVSILGDGNPSPWVVQYENLGDSHNPNMVCFLTEKSGTIAQKIRIGGGSKYENDIEFKMDDVVYIQDVTNEGIESQTIKLPFNHLSVNGNNLNPSIVEYNTDDMVTDQNCLIFTLNTSYKYIRSYNEPECTEIVSTFKAKKTIGCIMAIDPKKFINMSTNKSTAGNVVNEIPVLMVDVLKDGNFQHIRVIICWNDDSSFTVKVVTSIIKKPEIIKKLESLNKVLEKKPTTRRFSRSNGGFITHNFIIPSTMEESYVEELVEKYGISDVLGSENIICHRVNIDDDGMIIEDKDFDKIQKTLVKNKIKALTLVDCKCKPTLFTMKPLYIFICNETEKVSGKSVGIRCIKTN